MIHYYCVVTISTPLTADTVSVKDDVETLEKGTKTLAKEAILKVGNVVTDTPDKITHSRMSLDGQKILVEVTQDKPPTLKDFTDQFEGEIELEILGKGDTESSREAARKLVGGKEWEN